MAFAAYTSALLVAAVFSWLAIQHNTAVGVAQLTVTLSGNGIGGFALLLGILRDDRAQKAEQKAAKAQEETAKAQQETAKAQQETAKVRQEATKFMQESEQQRQRAERAEAELARLRTDLAARVLRLETAAGLTPPDASGDATEN